MKRVLTHIPEVDFEWEISTELENISYYTNLIKEGNGNSLNTMNYSVLGTLLRVWAFTRSQGIVLKYPFPADYRNYVQMKLNAGLGSFDFALNPGEPIKVVLGDEQFILEGRETDRGISIGDWKSIFEWSIISNNEAALNRLLQIPESIFEESSLHAAAYLIKYQRFLRSLYTEPEKSSGYLMEAYEAADPEKDERFSDLLLNYISPEMDVWVALLMRDAKLFNERLEKALHLQREYVERKKLQQTPGYLIRPMLIAICVLAHRNGFPIEVESDYIPRFLIEGKF